MEAASCDNDSIVHWDSIHAGHPGSRPVHSAS